MIIGPVAHYGRLLPIMARNVGTFSSLLLGLSFWSAHHRHPHIWGLLFNTFLLLSIKSYQALSYFLFVGVWVDRRRQTKILAPLLPPPDPPYVDVGGSSVRDPHPAPSDFFTEGEGYLSFKTILVSHKPT